MKIGLRMLPLNHLARMSVLPLLLLLVASSAFAESLRDRLQGFEWDARSHQFTEAAIPALTALARSGAEKLFLRRRAVAVLGTLDSEQARRALQEMAADVSLDTVQRRAIDELCQNARQFGLSQEVQASLLTLLQIKQEQARFRAASCLRGYQNRAEVTTALETYYQDASNWERRILEQSESGQ